MLSIQLADKGKTQGITNPKDPVVVCSVNLVGFLSLNLSVLQKQEHYLPFLLYIYKIYPDYHDHNSNYLVYAY